MAFYLCLCCLIWCLPRGIFGFVELEDTRRFECTVRVETDDGLLTCANDKCSDIKDPWRILQTHYFNRPCFIHYLTLSFTNYDHLLVFAELQATNNNSLDIFFANNDSIPCILEIEIDDIYPFDNYYFLTEDTLRKIGGVKENIHLLNMNIKNWYRSTRSVIQFINNEMIKKQPFHQINISYPCNFPQRRARLLLEKHLPYQRQSTCPAQIKIVPDRDIFADDKYDRNIDNSIPTSHIYVKNMSRAPWTTINQNTNSSRRRSNRTSNLFNRSNWYHNKKKKDEESDIVGTITAMFALIIVIIILLIFNHFFPSANSNNTQGQNP